MGEHSPPANLARGDVDDAGQHGPGHARKTNPLSLDGLRTLHSPLPIDDQILIKARRIASQRVTRFHPEPNDASSSSSPITSATRNMSMSQASSATP